MFAIIWLFGSIKLSSSLFAGSTEISNSQLQQLSDINTNETIQTQIDSKQATIDNSNRLDAELIHNGNISNTEFGYLNGVTSAIQTQIDSKQATLTFGITDTNAVKIDGSSAADDSYARFTASGIEGRTTAELKSDIGLDNVTNESKTAMFKKIWHIIKKQFQIVLKALGLPIKAFKRRI